MINIFNDAWAFNQPLTSWNTSLVTRMDNMFRKAYTYNQPMVSLSDAQVNTLSRMDAMHSRAARARV
jgi:surface protein